MFKLLALKISGHSSTYKIVFRNMADSISIKPIESVIRKKLNTTFLPTYMDVINESYMHNVPKGAETHFKVVVVSNQFTDLPLIKRHRMVMDLLKEELANGVHALSIVAKSPSQWEDSEKIVKPSPNCRGGFGK